MTELPQYDEGAEQAVIGALLIDPTTVPRIAAALGAADFGRKDHAQAYRTITEMAERGQAIDVTTVAAAMGVNGKETAYLAQLAKETLSTANVDAYAGIVQDLATRRRALTQARQLVKALQKAKTGADAIAAFERAAQELPVPSGASGAIRAADLMGMRFRQVQWVVPGIIARGITIVGGKPKLGKSWLVDALAIAISAGGVALGQFKVPPGRVLLLALEDNPRRLQKRLQKLLDGAAPSELLDVATEWPRADQGGLQQLDNWLRTHPDAALVVVDTLKKFKPPAARGASAYDSDYDSVQGLKALADRHDVAILIVHHLRKGVSDDPLEEISGTLGLTGGVDGALILRRDRGSADATLYVTGRDIEQEQDLALSWDQGRCLWSVVGSAEDARMSEERREVVELLQAEGAMSISDIAKTTRRKYDGLRKLVNRMLADGQLTRRMDGRVSVSHMSGVSGPKQDTQDIPDIQDTQYIQDTCTKCGGEGCDWCTG